MCCVVFRVFKKESEFLFFDLDTREKKKRRRRKSSKLRTLSHPRYEGASTAHPRCLTNSLRNGSLIAIVPAFSWKKISNGPLGGRAPGGRTSQACSLVPSEAESHTSS